MGANKQVANDLKENINNISQQIIDDQYKNQNKFQRIYQTVGHQNTFNDVKNHIHYLAEALSASQPVIFSNYVTHATTILDNIALPPEIFKQTLTSTQKILKKELDPSLFNLVSSYIETGHRAVEKNKYSISSFLQPDQPLYSAAQKYLDQLLAGKGEQAKDLIFSLIKDNIKLEKIYLNIFQPVHREIGLLFYLNEINTAEEHYCSNYTKRIMSQLFSYYYPLTQAKKQFNIIAACIENEQHDIGLRMLSDFLELEGWNTYYTGADTKISDILAVASQFNADIIALSATNYKTISTLEKLITTLKSTSEYSTIKVVVGGYAFNTIPDLWQEIGADGYASNIQQAIPVIKNINR